MSNTIGAALASELEHEAVATRAVLERCPADKFDYKPHEKSMTMGRLAVHVAEMVNWAEVTCTTTELDFGGQPFEPFQPKTTRDLLDYFEKNLNGAINALKNASDSAMMEPWTLKNGEQVYFTMPRIQTLRGMVFNHIWHHRGQLSVYLRLNDISVPSIYGPSADEGQM